MKTRADSNILEDLDNKYWRTVVPEMHGRASVLRFANVLEDDKVKFDISPGANGKAIKTTEYCPAPKIEKDGAKLWTLTLKGDDIERLTSIVFHELVLMCPEIECPLQASKWRSNIYVRVSRRKSKKYNISSKLRPS
ncbi:hypothetical protein Tco_0741392 [Tanacetum coccineum]